MIDWRADHEKQAIQNRNRLRRVFEVPHRDFVSFSTRKTSLIVSYEENPTEHHAPVIRNQ